MALSFGHVTSARVSHGSATVLDNLADGTFTILALVRRTGTATLRSLASKGTNAWNFSGGSTAGQLRHFQTRGTTNVNFVSDASALPLNEWRWVATTYDNALSDTTQSRLYSGPADGVLAEVAYSTQTPGVGTNNDDGASDLIVGNLAAGFVSGWPGDIQHVRVENVVMTLADMWHHTRCPEHFTASTILLVSYTEPWRIMDSSSYVHPTTITNALPTAPPYPVRLRSRRYLVSPPAAAAGQPTMRRWAQVPGMHGAARVGRVA